MDWKDRLIFIYAFIDDVFQDAVAPSVARMSNNTSPNFTDVEALASYIYGLSRGFTQIKQVYHYLKDHLLDWFPRLPSYQKYNERLNKLSIAFMKLTNILSESLPIPLVLQGQALVDALVDSFPIILAKGSRADTAKIAKQIANKGYCPSKNLYYHGIKLHALGFHYPSKLPVNQCIVLSKASENDNTVFKEQIAPYFRNLRVFGDKIFHDQAGMGMLKEQFNIEVMPCQKRKKGQQHLNSKQKISNTLVSKVRQPIEGFFAWLERMTNIQIASKTRSTNGVLKHIFSRLTLAFFILIAGPNW